MSSCNISTQIECKPGPKQASSAIIITNGQHYTITLINYAFLCSIVSTLGIFANVINLIVFFRQGLNTTINISFFSLAISDLFSLVFQQISNLYINPLFVALDLPIVYSEVQFMTARLVRVLFTRVTFFITVYITAERCLCIAFPLHIKQIITPKRTAVTLVLIFVLTSVTFLPSFSTTYLGRKFHAARNKTLLGLVFRKYKNIVIATSYFIQAISGLLAFLAIAVLTLILVHKLRQKSEWRKTVNIQPGKSESMSQRDRGTVKMVVLIAGILILCYTPSVVLCLTTFLEPEFTEGGRYYNMYSSLWSIAMVMENINSSVNIFFYLKMSSKYRHTCKELFTVCLRYE